jgi:tRNA threonylcarbamoyladenosine biosynthesis protein TsaE
MNFSLKELPAIAAEVIQKAVLNKSSDHATLITFSGDLGAGKTTLIQEIAKLLGVEEGLQSPTYVIYKSYRLDKPHPAASPSALSCKERDSEPWKLLIHGDMYRLESSNEVDSLGWEDLLKNPENILLIEWPEKIADKIPDWALKVTINHINQGEMRHIDF